MPRHRLSIAALMGLVLLVAVGFAALRHPTEWWASGLYLVTVVLLLFALLGALVKRGEKRLPWLGGAVFGYGYFLLVLSTGVLNPPVLPTAYLVGFMNTYLIEPDPTPITLTGNLNGFVDPTNISIGAFTVTPIPGNVMPPTPPLSGFPPAIRFQIGHCLFTLLFAALGSFAVRFLTKPDEPPVD